jgi:transposase-like protein
MPSCGSGLLLPVRSKLIKPHHDIWHELRGDSRHPAGTWRAPRLSVDQQDDNLYPRLCRNAHLRPSEVCSPSMICGKQRGRRERALSFTGAPCPQATMLLGVRWSVAYPRSTRHGEALLLERGGHGAHAPSNRWGGTYRPPLAEAFHRRKQPVGGAWAPGRDLPHRAGRGAVSLEPSPPRARPWTFCARTHREKEAGGRWRKQAIRRPGGPPPLTMDRSEAHEAARQRSKEAPGTASALRQAHDWKKLVAQAPRAGKRGPRPRLGGPSFEAAPCPCAGVERRPLLTPRQMAVAERTAGRPAPALCDPLAASSRQLTPSSYPTSSTR